MVRLVRFPLAVLFLILTVTFFMALKSRADGFDTLAWKAFKPILMGGGAYILFVFLLSRFRRSMNFAHTFCHELNHAVFGFIFLRRLKSFQAHAEKGGNVSFEGKPNLLICLAPYSVPLFAFFVLLLKLFALPAAFPPIHFGVGFFILFHCHSVFNEFRFYQTDLRVYGFFLSFAFVLFLNLLWLSWIMISATYSFTEGIAFLKDGVFALQHIPEQAKTLLCFFR